MISPGVLRLSSILPWPRNFTWCFLLSIIEPFPSARYNSPSRRFIPWIEVEAILILSGCLPIVRARARVILSWVVEHTLVWGIWAQRISCRLALHIIHLGLICCRSWNTLISWGILFQIYLKSINHLMVSKQRIAEALGLIKWYSLPYRTYL